MLKIQNLHCVIDELEILQGVDLELLPGKIQILMGKNGSGKSTLAKTIAGHPSYEITKGSLILDEKDITSLEADERSRRGIFMAFQYPVEIPGVNFSNFLRMAYNSRLPKEERMPVFKFRKLLKEKASILEIPDELLDRNLNEGMSGGEKKKMEILQMAVLAPKYVILDETDSGLDLDALRDVFEGIKKIKSVAKTTNFLIITHYQRIFDYITPDSVHVMQKGKIIREGGKEIIDQIEKEGYKIFE